MAAAQVLAVGSGAATSADFAVTGPTTVALKFASAPSTSPSARVSIQLKDDGGAYWPQFELTARALAAVIVGPGTFRAQRLEGACGVFTG